MLVIKCNLTISTGEGGNQPVIAYADLNDYDISNATVIEGDTYAVSIYSNESIIVTGEVSYEQ